MSSPGLPARFQVLAALPATEEGELWRARDTVLGREVLLKRPPALFSAAEAELQQKSLREARALARVRHEGIVRLLDVVETPQGPLLVIEPWQGRTLERALEADGPFAPERARALGIELASALEAVHALGIVHRGVASANVVLRPDGRALLTGFTFAKSAAGAAPTVPGTTFLYKRAQPGAAGHSELQPPHPAPEQLLGQVADARADVFGLGWVLYEALTGASPHAIEVDPRDWVTPEFPREVPRALAQVVLTCLAREPERRYASAGAVKAALEALPARRDGSRRWTLIAAGLTFALAGGYALFAFTQRGAQDPHAADRGAPLVVRPAGRYAPRYESSRALLIGIGPVYAETGFAPLDNAERDVTSLQGKLESLRGGPPWQVRPLLGPQATRDGILGAIRELSEAARPDDELFVYYAGHGEAAKISESLAWIVPAGAPTASADPSRAQWISFDDLHHVLDDTRAKHVLLAMDCCYGGRMTQLRDGSPTAFEEKLLTEAARVVICSGRADQRVQDGVLGEHSPFAAAFLEALSSPGAHITSSEIYAFINRRLAGCPDSRRVWPSRSTARPARSSSTCIDRILAPFAGYDLRRAAGKAPEIRRPPRIPSVVRLAEVSWTRPEPDHDLPAAALSEVRLSLVRPRCPVPLAPLRLLLAQL
jgi:hypothetical protein